MRKEDPDLKQTLGSLSETVLDGWGGVGHISLPFKKSPKPVSYFVFELLQYFQTGLLPP